MALELTVLDIDFPLGSRNKTATLVTGDTDAMLIDAGFTRADGHRLVGAVLDSGRTLKTIFVSHADPDFYWGLEPLVAAFPDARVVGTGLVVDHIKAAYEGKLVAWKDLGANLPTRLVPIERIEPTSLSLEGVSFEFKGHSEAIPDRHYLWQAEQRLLLGGVYLFEQLHVWVADTATPALRAAWIDVLDGMDALKPAVAIPGHRRAGLPLGTDAIGWTRDYLHAFERAMDEGADGEAVTKALTTRFPDAGLGIAATLGPKVAKGEMSWG